MTQSGHLAARRLNRSIEKIREECMSSPEPGISAGSNLKRAAFVGGLLLGAVPMPYPTG
jgi:hypothetical protein